MYLTKKRAVILNYNLASKKHIAVNYAVFKCNGKLNTQQYISRKQTPKVSQKVGETS